MGRVVFLCALAAVFVVFVSGLDKSDLEKFESMDISSILSNNRLRSSYVNCMIDKGPCTADGAEFKKIIPSLMESNCAECSPKFKEMIKKSIGTFKKDFPEDYKMLMDHYDPEGKRTAAMEEFMSS